MDPWGATAPMDWWTVVNRCRALENIAYVVAANQGASLQPLPAVLVAGRQHGGRLRGRILAQADPPGRARRSSSRRWEPSTRCGHERRDPSRPSDPRPTSRSES
jgi:predicted amidohydrolase